MHRQLLLFPPADNPLFHPVRRLPVDLDRDLIRPYEVLRYGREERQAERLSIGAPEERNYRQSCT